MTLGSMTHSSFAPHLNSKFQVSNAEEETIEVELVETFELTDAPTQERFSLIFRGALDLILNQGTYRFKHEQLGELELFIVPIRQDTEGRFYEAAFNRTRKPTH
jgi:hypothetical protein